MKRTIDPSSGSGVNDEVINFHFFRHGQPVESTKSVHRRSCLPLPAPDLVHRLIEIFFISRASKPMFANPSVSVASTAFAFHLPRHCGTVTFSSAVRGESR